MLTVLLAMTGQTPVRAQQSSASPSAAPSPARHEPEIRLLFTGDILLSRQVAAEIRLKRQSPWSNLGDLFRSAALTVSGFELRPQPSSPADLSGEIWIEGFIPRSPSAQRTWRTRPAPVLSLEAGSFIFG